MTQLLLANRSLVAFPIENAGYEGDLAENRGTDPIFPTQRIPRGRDPILSTQRIPSKIFRAARANLLTISRGATL